MVYAKAVGAAVPDFDVFPSNEAVLLDAREGKFAGCISASANVNAAWCKRAFQEGDGAALEVATRIRALVSRRPLIPSVKALLAHRLNDPEFGRLVPPLMALDADDARQVARDFDGATG